MAGSISFDHAAETYDATRALPEHVARKLTDALAAEIAVAGADRVLEIGVGTGRIARPLAERGIRVVGVDIAPRMLAKLREQLGQQHAPVDVALGDAAALPFATASLRAVLMVHVLHVVSSWERALEELGRVLAPGGVLLHPVTRYPGDNPWTAGFEKRHELLATLGFTPRKRPGPEQINDELRRLGASPRTIPIAEDEERTTPAFWLQRTHERIDSWSWEIPEDLFPAFYAQYEQWNREHFGDLQREYLQRAVYELEVWTFP